jgi:hypothetical protein
MKSDKTETIIGKQGQELSSALIHIAKPFKVDV